MKISYPRELIEEYKDRPEMRLVTLGIRQGKTNGGFVFQVAVSKELAEEIHQLRLKAWTEVEKRKNAKNRKRERAAQKLDTYNLAMKTSANIKTGKHDG